MTEIKFEIRHKRKLVEINEDIIFPKGFVLGSGYGKDFSVVAASRSSGRTFQHDLVNLSDQSAYKKTGEELLEGLFIFQGFTLLSGTEFSRFIQDYRSQELKVKYGIEGFKRTDPNVMRWHKIAQENYRILEDFWRNN